MRRRTLGPKALFATGSVLAMLLSCRPVQQDAAADLKDDEQSPAAVAAPNDPEFSAAKRDFFDDRKMYYVRIKGWNDDWLQPNALRDEREVAGSVLEIHRTNASSDKHCPDGEVSDGTRLHRAKAFSVRTSGNMTNGTPKSSYKIKMNGDAGKFLGMKALNLKSMWNDASQLREALAWRLFRQAGVIAPGHTYVKFCVNNRYFGLYSLIENVDSALLKSHFGKNSKGNLFKAYWIPEDLGPAELTYREPQSGQNPGKAYYKKTAFDDRTYQLKTNDDPADVEFQTYDDLAALIRIINGKTGGDGYVNTNAWRDEVQGILNAKAFLRWAAVNALLGAWDNYWATPSNYYIYNAGRKEQPKKFMEKPYFYLIPWDYDHTFGITYWSTQWQYTDIVDWPASTKAYHGGNKTSKLPLLVSMLKNESYLKYYLDFIEWFIDHHFNDEAIETERKKLWEHIKGAAYLEADQSDCTGSGDFRCAHTGRQYSNHEVYLQGDKQDEMSRGGMKLEGIIHYVKMRQSNVRDQLKIWRQKYPRGSSGEADLAPAPSPVL